MKNYIIILITGFVIGQPDQLPILNDIDFQIKENGLLIEFSFSSDIPLNHASGWYAQTGWFYVTLLNTTIDSSTVPSIQISELVNCIIVRIPSLKINKLISILIILKVIMKNKIYLYILKKDDT